MSNTNSDLVRRGATALNTSASAGANRAGDLAIKASVIAAVLAAIPGSILFPILALLIVGGFLKLKF